MTVWIDASSVPSNHSGLSSSQAGEPRSNYVFEPRSLPRLAGTKAACPGQHGSLSPVLCPHLLRQGQRLGEQSPTREHVSFCWAWRNSGILRLLLSPGAPFLGCLQISLQLLRALAANRSLRVPPLWPFSFSLHSTSHGDF